jgi:teichuronic acid biosynthesis glycosyltransferase TuaH
LVLEMLALLPTAQLQLAGPVETRLPRHPRVHHVGILPHEALAEFSAGCDVMLMPFVVNRLIEAVDPVKLYEYIAFGRPALAPRYPESERFAQWVTLYRNVDEAVSSLPDMLAKDTSSASGKARADFLAEHTWSKRAIQIERLLAALARGRDFTRLRALG